MITTTAAIPAIGHTTAATTSPVAGHHSAEPQPIGESANPHEVRNADIATFWRNDIMAEVLEMYPDVESLEADGFRSTNPSYDGPQHYTIGGYTDSDSPAIMVENGRIVGIMLQATRGEVDLGAGEWHRHSNDPNGVPVMHVWFDRPLSRAFGGHQPGFQPLDENPIEPKPKDKAKAKPKLKLKAKPEPLPEPLPFPDPRPIPVPMPDPMPPRKWTPPSIGCGCMPPYSPTQAARSGAELVPLPSVHEH